MVRFSSGSRSGMLEASQLGAGLEKKGSWEHGKDARPGLQ